MDRNGGSTWKSLDVNADTDAKTNVSDIFTAADTFNATPIFNSGATFNNTAPIFNTAPTFNVLPVFNSGATFNNTAPTLNKGADFANKVTEQSGTTSFTNDNQLCQMFVTDGLSLAPLQESGITLTNSLVSSSSVCMASIGSYGGNGTPMVRGVVPASGSATITVYNAHSANTITTEFRVAFIVF